MSVIYDYNGKFSQLRETCISKDAWTSGIYPLIYIYENLYTMLILGKIKFTRQQPWQQLKETGKSEKFQNNCEASCGQC